MTPQTQIDNAAGRQTLPAAQGRPFMPRWVGVLPLLLAIFAWAAASGAGVYSTALLPSPDEVARAFIQQPGELLRHTLASMARVSAGVGLAILTAIPLGLLVGRYARLERLLDWTIQFCRSCPPIALIPLAILFFGIGERPAIILIWVAAFWPLLINTIFGVKSTEKTLIRVSNAARASEWLLFKDVLVPSATPYILTGLRLAIGSGWLTVVAAEMMAVKSGLGYLITYAQTIFRPDLVIAGIIVIGLIGLLLDQAVRLLRSRICRWQDGLTIND